MSRYTQVELVSLLKAFIDAGGESHKKAILGLMATENIGSKFVMHNIGKKRREWLQAFLQGK